MDEEIATYNGLIEDCLKNYIQSTLFKAEAESNEDYYYGISSIDLSQKYGKKFIDDAKIQLLMVSMKCVDDKSYVDESLTWLFEKFDAYLAKTNKIILII